MKIYSKLVMLWCAVLALVCCNNNRLENKQDSLPDLPQSGYANNFDTLFKYADSAKSDFYFDTAVALRNKEGYQKSNTYFSLALLSHFKEPYRAYNYMALNYFDLKDYDNALYYAGSAIKCDKKRDYHPWHTLAMLRYMNGWKKSEICFIVDSAIVMGDASKDVKKYCDSAKD